MDGAIVEALLTGLIAAALAFVGWSIATIGSLYGEYNGPEMSRHRNLATRFAKRNRGKNIEEMELAAALSVDGRGFPVPEQGFFSLWIVARFFDRAIEAFNANWLNRRPIANLLGFHFLWWRHHHFNAMFAGLERFPIAKNFDRFDKDLKAFWHGYERAKEDIEDLDRGSTT